ncbi:MAG: Dam family site-specific DNA-(adenine-N6)-methyltransferase [Myxococcota bacterium]
MNITNKIYIPPIKCQGIKTKVAPLILANISLREDSVWFEPFMGSGVVGFNARPNKALFSDINPHLINFYNAIKSSEITPAIAREFLEEQGASLRKKGDEYYYFVRKRFNSEKSPLDFLFLSRACFNGMIRFNRAGNFNVPFCKKPERFSKAYITKIANQIEYVWQAVRHHDWRFKTIPFWDAIPLAKENDIIYCDPPYLGRYTDYFDTWSEEDEHRLFKYLSQTKAKFILSTWLKNKYRQNKMISTLWKNYYIITKEHFYHVGAKETNRNSMTEALVMNFVPLTPVIFKRQSAQQTLAHIHSATK